jgi:type I restriction enzyme M protein
MITKDNFQQLLETLAFTKRDAYYYKKIHAFELQADFNNETLIYPKGLIVNDKTTSNFSSAENFVVFECVHRLLTQGYHPKHIELEPKWQVGHGASGGKADILVKDNDNKSLLIIECKTAGSEFTKAWNTTQTKPTQLFSYVQQTRSTKFIALYASDFIDNQVVSNYYLINVCDNEALLKNDSKLLSYKEATTVEEIYRVWSETYSKEYATLGVFEDNKPYDIGKTKFTKDDLKNINSKDIQGKYHEFATILRQHNVSGRENAFDKLVNLFLCKVVDEKENSDELKFYWKGKAYDNPFDFQDRLQKLYKNGMEKFLNETITYIDNAQIDEAFEVFKERPNATKDKIKEFMKAQKFFTNNDFAFIDVHNEKLFYQNFEVLLKIARMIQDISLTGSDENQFLGDMFEGFLDQGVKQSEGQFFTPMPIVKFIINSLPKKQEPNVIDYACGAGHFLNEYFATNDKSKIVGIEKEYRLSKVAKVSSFMYGSDMDIVYDDALKKSQKAKDDSFDVLIANPPYSVKGFLETLSDEERVQFELIKTIDEKSYTANNAIECFFIERAKQLLSKDGVAGIVVPSSILNKGSQSITSNKGNVYVATREIILKYFNIIAIAEFGSGTFGKTGTNTVTLFLKRRTNNPNLPKHYENMIDTWFECDFDINRAFKDNNIVEKYCSHIDIDLELYKTILCQKIDEKIFENDTFKEYKQEFEKLSDTKNRRKRKQYKELSQDKKEELEQKELIKYIRAIEKDKLFYFALAYKNSSDVVIVKSPSKTNENKKFLGYEWSSAKGNEGIKYLTNSKINIDDETLDEEDKRILENLQGLKDINTPLYNPNNSDDTSKINKIIKDNFESIETEIPEDLSKYVSRAKLVDMLDFSRVDFNKALSLTPSKKVEIESKYPLVKLTDKFDISKGKIITQKDAVEGMVKVVSGGVDFAYFHNQHNRPKNIITVSASGANAGYINFWKEEIFASDCTTIYSENLTSIVYAYYVLKVNQDMIFDLARGSAQPHVYPKDIESFKIPLPPLDIQEQIVKECQKVDDEVLKANETIEQTKETIENEINSVSGEMVKLGDIGKISMCKRIFKNQTTDNGDIPFYKIGTFGKNANSFINKELFDEYVSRFSYPKKGDILISTSGTIGRTVVFDGKPAYFQDSNIVWIDNNEAIVLNSYLNYIFQNIKWSPATGITIDRLYNKIIEETKIKLPSLETQKQIISKIEKLETKINEAKKVIDGAKEKKEAILKEYL